ncbi:AsmA-like C-terminal region-containing protein [Muricauda oceani]|uniref:AsmA-like C-terminal region-containing protein n=1 Tax=Flagellimonas oceani TaxID=2698672 RepID=A0A6G7J6L7_9FLAO|nr:AsmA-like C-terminal region-containing protein [Allomuricauda oceani]MBW8242309.1 AsmA-like C-terminal region-containing protein [Allomuricauda oceani]QII46067.1 AsmA-like C-terminal region-containing protein [Allomuricauda oceani]
MKLIFLKKRKFWWRFVAITFVLPISLFGTLLFYIHNAQKDIIADEISALNQQHKGLIVLADSKLSLFGNFPYISMKLYDLQIYESKADNAPLIINIDNLYVGLNLWDITKGKYDIQSLRAKEGTFNMVLHKDGTNNLQNALKGTGETEEDEPFNFHLKKIKLQNLDIHKLDEATNMDIETFIHEANGGFKLSEDSITAHVETNFQLNVFDNGKQTYVHHKNFELSTDISFNKNTGILDIKPSRITMEHGDFELDGSLDTRNDMNIDLRIKGSKPNFDMFIAFAPENLIPVLERYKNQGKIYLNGVVQGPLKDGRMPFIEADFGASEAYLENTKERKRINQMGFNGHFTNGEARSMKTMKFTLANMNAKLESGNFSGSIMVENFEEPEVDMQLDVDFNLAFMTKFLNITDIENASGNVSLKMNFHDIIDLDNPENALSDLNKAYFSELKVSNLSIASSDMPAPLEQLDMQLLMNGKQATLDTFNIKMGKSDLSITGYVSDLPAIFHHTETPVNVHLDIQSNVLDLAELTRYSTTEKKGVNEQITDLSAGFSFIASAKDFTESQYLPKGEFFVDSLYAKLKHYPHQLHDFHADILIDDKDLKIVDFMGQIDDSDFHLNGLAHDYRFWMKDTLNGNVDLEITLASDLLRLEDIFSYKGENYVPEQYRHEEFEKLTLHVNSRMHYKDSALHSIDLDMDRLDTKMHLHPMRFQDFNGRIHYEDKHLVVENLQGKIGRTVFDLNLNYYLGEDQSIKKRDNSFALNANYIDYDQLFSFNAKPSTPKNALEIDSSNVTEHEKAFNIYELPFTDMQFDIQVDHFIRNRIDFKNINARLRTTQNHYVYVDTLSMDAAGGHLNMSGYFNGSDPKHIYLSPNLTLTRVDIDQLLFKFENFGQDHLVSENLHGKVSSQIKGKIRVYPDLVPNLDESEIHMAVEVLNGRLVNYKPMSMLSDYMGDKNLENVRFDTLQNRLDIVNGKMNIPKMTVESTLGHMELSGSQDLEHNIEYYFKIPWKTVKRAAVYKLFGNKKNKDSIPTDDKIIEVDPNKKIRYLNLKIHGNINDYKISLGKDKS